MRLKSKQQGATLLLALIFLVVLTAASITAMRLSNTEEKMASGSQFRNDSFQLAQSELASHVINFNNTLAKRVPLQAALGKAADPVTGFPDRKAIQTLTAAISSTKVSNQAADVRFMANLDCANLGFGDSYGLFECRQYELHARSTLQSGAFSDQNQGIYFWQLK